MRPNRLNLNYECPCALGECVVSLRISGLDLPFSSCRICTCELENVIHALKFDQWRSLLVALISVIYNIVFNVLYLCG